MTIQQLERKKTLIDDIEIDRVSSHKTGKHKILIQTVCVLYFVFVSHYSEKKNEDLNDFAAAGNKGNKRFLNID